MNDQNPKKILFNKATLLSLKAELMKKQEEVYEKKQLPQNKIENFKPAKAPDTKDVNESKKSFKDSLKPVDTEELESCRKAKLALEKKAELYDHLSDSAGNSQLASRFLVDFNTKKQENCKSGPDESNHDGRIVSHENDESEWTEFTDCLGRTRKCHKSDLELYMQRDMELMGTKSKDGVPDDDLGNRMNETNIPVEKPLLVQKTNDYLMSLREKWEEKEKELLAKDKDIHYQDLLFDEARMHGVGYFAFSTDETERQKQMEELMKRRQETLQAQKDAEETRKKRDELMAARVAAARARQRARAGLPPEEPKVIEKDFATCLLEFLTQQRNEADAQALEKEKKMKEEQERERQKLREAYVREWDVGKEGVDGKVKKFREMTQEEYVEQQRDKRIDEFAPLQSSASSQSEYSFDEKGKILYSDSSVPVKKSWSDVRPRVNSPPPPPDIGDISEQKGLYFTTAKKTEANLKYRNFVKAQESTPIVNELHGNDSDNILLREEYALNHTEIAPPPTYDYYGPAAKYSRPNKPFESDIREAYAQGAKSLESKSNYKQLPKHYDFTFD